MDEIQAVVIRVRHTWVQSRSKSRPKPFALTTMSKFSIHAVNSPVMPSIPTASPTGSILDAMSYPVARSERQVGISAAAVAIHRVWVSQCHGHETMLWTSLRGRARLEVPLTWKATVRISATMLCWLIPCATTPHLPRCCTGHDAACQSLPDQPHLLSCPIGVMQ